MIDDHSKGRARKSDDVGSPVLQQGFQVDTTDCGERDRGMEGEMPAAEHRNA